jgi:hypothetical protein
MRKHWTVRTSNIELTTLRMKCAITHLVITSKPKLGLLEKLAENDLTYVYHRHVVIVVTAVTTISLPPVI